VRVFKKLKKEESKMKINEVLETTAQELEAKKVEFGKKVLKELKLVNKVEISREEYFKNKDTHDHVLTNKYYRVEYPEFTHEQIVNLYNLKNEIRQFDELMYDYSSSNDLGKVYSIIGWVTLVIALISGAIISSEVPPFGFATIIIGILISINYFAIADILKTLKKISMNTETKEKSI